jgi:hypothetical protein
MLDHTQPDAALNRLSRFFFLDTLDGARDLLGRYHQVESFNLYVNERRLLVVSALLVLFLISIGCVMGVFTLLPDMHWSLVLPILLLLPVILAGSLFVQIYAFFSWIEGRSMRRALGTRRITKRGSLATWLQKKFKVDLGPLPKVPWVLSTLFLFAPLLLLAYSWLPAAAAFVGLAILLPVTYAAFDR